MAVDTKQILMPEVNLFKIYYKKYEKFWNLGGGMLKGKGKSVINS